MMVDEMYLQKSTQYQAGEYVGSYEEGIHGGRIKKVSTVHNSYRVHNLSRKTNFFWSSFGTMALPKGFGEYRCLELDIVHQT